MATARSAKLGLAGPGPTEPEEGGSLARLTDAFQEGQPSLSAEAEMNRCHAARFHIPRQGSRTNCCCAAAPSSTSSGAGWGKGRCVHMGLPSS